jgi:hypothetical protein
LDWFALIPAAITGGLFGTLATLFAPWVSFGIDKRKMAHESRKQLLLAIRTLASQDIGRGEFRRTPEFHQIQPFLSEKTLAEIEKPQNHITFTTGEPGIDGPAIRLLLADLARIEREWKLI